MPLPRTALARRKLLRMLGLVAVGAAAGTAASAGSPRLVGPAMAAEPTLPRPRDWQALLSEAAAGGHPVVVLFSTPGCAYCRFVRHDHLRHLAAASPGGSGVHVVELSLADRRPFDLGTAASPVGAAGALQRAPDSTSPAALAASLGIRFAPTVACANSQLAGSRSMPPSTSTTAAMYSGGWWGAGLGSGVPQTVPIGQCGGAVCTTGSNASSVGVGLVAVYWNERAGDQMPSTPLGRSMARTRHQVVPPAPRLGPPAWLKMLQPPGLPPTLRWSTL